MSKLTRSETVSQQEQLQTALTDANAALERAKAAANQLGQSFEFLGRTYTPTTTTPGHFDHEEPAEDWDSSDDWESSNC